MTKKLLFSLTACAAALFTAATLVSCSADEGSDFEMPTPITDSLYREMHTARLYMSAVLADFEGAEDETSYTCRIHRGGNLWQAGDTIYLQFKSYSNLIDGVAIYQNDNTWMVNYYGSLPSDFEGQCEAYFFDGAKSATSTEVMLDDKTAIYCDRQATWLLEGDEMRVTAHFKPMTGRIRFKSTTGTQYFATGFKSYTTYSITNNTFTSAEAFAEGYVGSDGYTPYYYGFFASESNKTITFHDAENYVFFSRQLPPTALVQGYSGCLSVPTMTDRNEWTLHELNNLIIKVNGVSFVMVPVMGGTFTMGATAEQTGVYSDEKPAHQVTLSSYYIGQTEVTQALWQAVTGYSPTSDGMSWYSYKGLGDNYPAYYISYNDVQSFITKLNSLTGRTFRMPTEAEWEYAARGGSKHKGYLYSGDNLFDDVAWCTNNSWSQSHPVAQKAANELGIYDMSGNVWEWCSDWYGAYTSSSQTNPTGPSSGSCRVLRGGGWDSEIKSCRVASRGLSTPSPGGIYSGVRLALSFSQ